MKLILIIVIILVVIGFLIISNENIRLNSFENIIYFFNIYYNYLMGFYNQGVEFTGQIIKFFD